MHPLIGETPGRRLGPPAALTLLALGLLLPGSARSAEDRVTVEPREKWSDVFGGTDVTFEFVVRAPRGVTGRAGWTFFAAANRQTIGSGEAAVAAAPGQPAAVKVRLRVPEVKEGAALRTRLRVAVFREGGREPEALAEKEIWVFPQNPFADRAQWLKDLKISLFDPENTTGKVFKDLKIPFDEITNPAAVGDLKEGLLIVGQGVSFADEYAGLPETLARLAAAGVPVLCLAPAGGAVALPGVEGPRLPLPRRLSFRRQDVITELDKRLDAASWPPGGKVVASTVFLKAGDGGVVGEVRKETGGWPWVEADFPDRESKLVYAGFSLFGEEWKAGPAPRFLLARLLAFMKPTAGDRPTGEKESD